MGAIIDGPGLTGGHPINYAKLTSYPAWTEDRCIPFSSPITFELDYDNVTTPITGALGNDLAMQYQTGYVTPVFKAVLSETFFDSGVSESDIVGSVEVEFNGLHAELTLTPKKLFDDWIESLKGKDYDKYSYFVDTQNPEQGYKQQAYDRVKGYLRLHLYSVAMVGGELSDALTNKWYETMSVWRLSDYGLDVALPPPSVSYLDLFPGSGAGTYAFKMLAVSTTYPPTEVTLSQSTAAPGQTIWLSWSGAEAGEANDIIGYEIYRANSADGEYSLLTSVSSTETEATVAVTAPTARDASYHYKVVTVGSLDGYNSSKSAVYASLTCNFATTTAPTSVTIDGPSNVEPGKTLTIRWANAGAGENNPISGYSICYSDTVDGAPLGLILGFAKLDNGTFDTFGSTADFEPTADFFHAPTENGKTYYFRVMTHGQIAGTNSAWSESYAAVTCTYSATNAPMRVTVGGAKSVYVAPSTELTLEWSGATDGANNKITGYTIFRDGEAYKTDLLPTDSTYPVPSHDTTGHAYTYSVVAKGQYADSAPSTAATVYSYTDPVAPTTVEISESETYAGGRVKLSWSGAEAGGYNEIVGYKVYVSDTVNGAQTLVATVASSETSASTFIDAPNTSGETFYVRVVTIGAHNDSTSSDYVTVTASGDVSEDSDVTVVVKPRVVEKRRIIFGDYDTARDGLWTLTGWSFEEPEVQTSIVSIPWFSLGGLDLSTVLTDGDPRYNRRTLAATFECSEGTRTDRNLIISQMVNKLHGRQFDIVLPDDPSRYITGRVSMKSIYSDMAHASVEVEANCEPWRYSKTETRLEFLATENPRDDVLVNKGRKVLVPELTVSGYKAQITLTSGDLSWTLIPGKYRLPDLRLQTGCTPFTYSGIGTLTITYREAIL